MAYGNRIQTQTVPVLLEGTRREILSSFIWSGKRFRIIWNRVYWFHPEQTFHEFLDYLLVHTFNREWLNKQAILPESEKHVIVSWRKALYDQLETAPNTSDGGWTLTGPVQAYFCLAYDLYWLQLINKLPKSLRGRLRGRESFQGARYEVLVAATFARAGFEIELLDESVKSAKHCEFIATHKRTGMVIYVEAKSRHRRGVLHQSGAFNALTDVKGDVLGLYSNAVKQAPQGHPYCIFIDANLPIASPGGFTASRNLSLDEMPWVKDIYEGLTAKRGNRVTPEMAVFVTNFAPHFGTEGEAAPPGMFLIFPSQNPAFALTDWEMLNDLLYCLEHYGTIPRQF